MYVEINYALNTFIYNSSVSITLFLLLIMNKTIGLSIVFAILITLFGFTLNSGHNWGGDFALYLEEGDAILSGTLMQLYQSNLFTVSHSNVSISPILEPPFSSFLYGIVAYLDIGNQLYVFKIMNLLFVLFTSYMLFSIFNNLQLNVWVNFFMVCAFATFWEVFFMLEIIGSDLLFLMLTSAILYCVTTKNSSDSLLKITFSILVILAYFTRDAGIVFILVWPLTHFLHSIFWKKPFKLRNSYALLPFVIFVIYKLTIPDFQLNQVQRVFNEFSVTNVLTRAAYIFNELGYVFVFVKRLQSPGMYVIIWVFLIYSSYVFLNSVDSFARIYLLSFYVFYIVLHLLWATAETWLLLPLILFHFIGIGAFLSKLKIRSPIKVVLTVIFCFGFMGKNLVRINNWCIRDNSVFSDRVCTADATEVWNFIRKETPKNSIVFFRKPTVLRYYTHRNSCVYMEDSMFLGSPSNTNYYWLNAKTLGKAKNHLHKVHVKFDTVFTNSNFELLKVKQL